MSKFNEDWIKGKLSSSGVEYAERLGTDLADKGMTTSQIRNIFSETKRIQAILHQGNTDHNAYTSFLMLRPKVAYTVARASSKTRKGIEHFQKEFDKMHAVVTENTESKGVTDIKKFEILFEHFCDLFEAILAFHKAKGGKD